MSDHGLPKLENGAVLTHIGADNLRALRMPEPVELRRLTFIVGRNGIGKSTFARLFPLLRQSAERRTREPLLWWDNAGVDFGDFQEAVRHGEQEIVFSFGFEAPGAPAIAGDAPALLVRSALVGAGREARVAWAEVVYEGQHRCKLRFTEAGELGGIEATLAGVRSTYEATAARDLLGPIKTSRENMFCMASLVSSHTLLSLTEEIFHGRTDVDRRTRIVRQFDWRKEDSIIDVLRGQYFTARNYQTNVKKLKSDGVTLSKIRSASFLDESANKLFEASNWVADLSMLCAYTGPNRATPSRGYRPFGATVEQIDARGNNMAEFLNALTPQERQGLNEYLFTVIGTRVFVDPDGSNLMLRIELLGKKYNLVDVGFGYSQVLPVIIQLWASSQRLASAHKGRALASFVIEQPELHLHPHQQVLLARAFGSSASQDAGPMLIVETHSDHLIGEIGRMVTRGELPPERVQVLCVEPHAEGGAKIRQATFDEDGYLTNWPVGFLSP